MWKKSTTIVRAGGIITFVGSYLIVAGIVAEDNNMLDARPASIGLGIGFVSIGIPMFTVGVARTSKLKKTLHYDTYKLVYLKVNPSISVNQFNGAQYWGMSLSLNF